MSDHFTTLPSKGLKVSRFDGYFLIFILNSFQLCAENCEEAAVIMQELEHLIHTNKSNIVWVMYHQGKMFQRFRERRFRERKRERERERERKFRTMVEKFGDSRLAIVFKISIVELIDIYQKLINITLSLNFIKG